MIRDARFLAGVGVGVAAGAFVGAQLLEAMAGLNDGKAAWFIVRASGVTAYLLLTASVVWGLLTSSRALFRWVELPLTAELHKVLSVLAVAVTGLHGGMLLFDTAFDFSLADVLVPLSAPYRPLAVTAGAIAAYLAAVLTWSFYVRQRIGQRLWRAVHYGGFMGFALATAHGVYAGTDSGGLWMGAVYAVSGATVLFLTYLRILGGRYVPPRRPAPTRAHSQGARLPATAPAQVRAD